MLYYENAHTIVLLHKMVSFCNKLILLSLWLIGLLIRFVEQFSWQMVFVWVGSFLLRVFVFSLLMAVSLSLFTFRIDALFFLCIKLVDLELVCNLQDCLIFFCQEPLKLLSFFSFVNPHFGWRVGWLWLLFLWFPDILLICFDVFTEVFKDELADL